MRRYDKVAFRSKVEACGYASDKIFIIIEPRAKMKDSETGRWVDAIIYSSSMDGMPYVLEKQEFIKTFKIITEE